MDVNVVIEARKGDREAFGRLMAEIRPALMAQACAILKDEFVADECVSETMMRIFEKLPQLRSAGSFPVWARRICANVCCSEYRRVRRDLSLQAVENVSFTALGKALSLSPNTVKSRFYRALRQLRKEFDADWTSPEGKNFKKISQRKGDDTV